MVCSTTMPNFVENNNNSSKYILNNCNRQIYYDATSSCLLSLFNGAGTLSFLNCKEKFYSACNHIHEVFQFVKQLMELLLECSARCRREIIPDNRMLWSGELQELKTRSSINAYKMWLYNDKLRNGFILQNKIKYHFDYKKAIIASKNKARYIFSDKLLD